MADGGRRTEISFYFVLVPPLILAGFGVQITYIIFSAECNSFEPVSSVLFNYNKKLLFFKVLGFRFRFRF